MKKAHFEMRFWEFLRSMARTILRTTQLANKTANHSHSLTHCANTASKCKRLRRLPTSMATSETQMAEFASGCQSVANVDRNGDHFLNSTSQSTAGSGGRFVFVILFLNIHIYI